MSKDRREKPKQNETANQIIDDIGRKARRKLRARQTRQDSIWHGMGMVGMVGWSVAIPTVIGIAVGLWLEERVEVSFSWTLTLLIVGVVIGCLNAWYWISKEHSYISSRHDEDRSYIDDSE
jgi:ATP synthase protein I